MSGSLTVAYTNEGVKLLLIPNGARIDLTWPVSARQFMEHEITDMAVVKQHMNDSMTLAEVREMHRKMGGDLSDIPKGMKKVALINRFVASLKATMEFYNALRPDIAEAGRETRVIEVNADMSEEDMMNEMRRQVPAYANASREELREIMAGATRVNEPSSSNAPPAHPAPPADVPVSVFAGQGYKLGEENFKTEDGDITTGGYANFDKFHIRPEMEFRMLPYENAPKETAVVDASMVGGTRIVEVNDKTSATVGKLEVRLECSNCTLDFHYFYDQTDKIKDFLEVLELNTAWSVNQMTLFYGAGNSYFMPYEPIYASILKMGGSNKCRLCIRQLGGGKSIRKDIKTTKRTPADFQKLYGDAFKEIAKTVKPVANLECMIACDKALVKFIADAECDASNAFKVAISNMDDEDMLNRLHGCFIMKGGTEYKLKQASRLLFGKALVELEEVSKMTTGVIDSAEMAVLTAYFGAVSKGDFGISELRRMTKTALDKKIGAREALDRMET
eukprot:Skav207095  [mRNA]  locus=scaffold2123:6607:8121:- [translate_table: standard]